MTGRPRGARNYSYRLTDTNLKHLEKIRQCGDWPDDSSALRFCIGFTKTMLSIIPEAVGESFVSSEPEGTTALCAEPEGTTCLTCTDETLYKPPG